MFHNYPHVFTKCISNLRRAETTFPFMMEDTIEDIEDEDLIETDAQTLFEFEDSFSGWSCVLDFKHMYDMVVLICGEVDFEDSTCSFRFTCTVDEYDCFLINITVFHSGDCTSNFHYSIPTKPSG